MHLSSEQLDAIEEMAYMLFPPVMIAINIEVDETDFCSDVNIPGKQARTAYYKGLLRHQMEMRASIMKAAKNGSNPAQQQMLNLMKELTAQIDG